MMLAPLVLGQISLSFHRAAAAVVAELLRELGHDVVFRDAPHEDMYALLQNREVDLVCSAWLPASHGKYIQPFEDQLEQLAVIYTPYCIWGIPSHAPTAIQSIADLAKPEIANLFRKRIQGINPGAGISRFSRMMVDEYGLAAQGFHFENGTLDDCTTAYLTAEQSDEFAIVPLWHPQWLHTETNLRELADPKGLLGGQDDATLVIRKDAKPKLDARALAMLRRINLGNTTVSKLDRDICVDATEPATSARRWITKNREICDVWIGKSDDKT